MQDIDIPKIIDFTLDLKPYLQKYATHQAGNKRLMVRASSEYGQYVLKHATYPPKGWRREHLPVKQRFKLRMHEEEFVNAGRGMWLSSTHLEFLASLIEKDFWLQLYEFVLERRMKYGEKELVSIRKFRHHFHISEEEYLEESMYKRFRRIKESRMKLVHTGFCE